MTAQAQNETSPITLGRLAETVCTPALKTHQASWRLSERDYEQYLKPALGHLPFKAIGSCEIDGLIDFVSAKNMDVSTQDCALYALKNLLREANAKGIYVATPTIALSGRIGKQKRQEKLKITRAQAEELFKDLSQTNGVAARAIEFILLTGAIKYEILSARRGNLNLKEKTLKVVTRGGREKLLNLNDPACEILARVVKKQDSPWLIPGRDPQKQLADAFAIWKKTHEKIGLPQARVGDLRGNIKDWHFPKNTLGPLTKFFRAKAPDESLVIVYMTVEEGTCITRCWRDFKKYNLK